MRKKSLTGIQCLVVKLLLTASVMLSSTYIIKAQVRERIVVKAGEDISSLLTSHGVYRFPEFRRGIVNFKDGTTAKALLNYNVVLNDMQFINPKGDTLVLDDTGLIDSIHIDTDVFYFQKGYLQVIDDYADNKLVVHQTNSIQYLKKGAMGRPDPTANVISYDRVPTLYFVDNQLTVNEDVVLIKETDYLLTYKKFKQVPANNSGFMKAFPDKKNEIESFVSANKIDFKKQDDLKKLFQFCVGHS